MKVDCKVINPTEQSYFVNVFIEKLKETLKIQE